jgi:hypothetical protein
METVTTTDDHHHGSPATPATHVDNALIAYLDDVQEAMRLVAATKTPTERFEPAWRLPERSERLERFFSTSSLSLAGMARVGDAELFLMDLTQNPGTGTTKTFGSHVIVARALRHTQDTGEPVLLLTPSAANKAVALRDAVLRAYRAGLATPETLRVVTIVPRSSLMKLWDSPMAQDPALAAGNRVGVYDGAEREDVKRLTTGAYREVADRLLADTGFRLWYTLDPDNYRVADVVRAGIEADALAPAHDRQRWHVHAVSSAYGFLGHDLGRRVLAERSGQRPGDARYLLVQHLETPDLVLSVLGRDEPPRYVADERWGVLRQAGTPDPRFPVTCAAPDERLERTFYTRNPPTTGAVRAMVERQGGDGMVVSLEECTRRYPEVRAMAAAAGMTRLPLDPRHLREWAMVMAVVGALNALERGLVPADSQIVVHGSGCYGEEHFDQLDRSSTTPVGTVADTELLLLAAACTDTASVAA